MNIRIYDLPRNEINYIDYKIIKPEKNINSYSDGLIKSFA